MLSRFFYRYNPFLSLVIVALAAVVLLATGCGSKKVDVTASGDHPANPNAPQAAFSEPADVLSEEMTTQTENNEEADEAHAHHEAEMVALSADGQAALTKMLDAYLAIGSQLASDTINDVKTQAYAMLEAFHTLEPEVPAEVWDAHADHTEAIHDFGHELADDISDIKAARIAYGSLSDAFNHFLSVVGVPADYSKPVYGYICGMASDVPQGGIWLQVGQDVRNPYFGSAMPKCHSETFEPPVAAAATSEHDHMTKEKSEVEPHHEHEHDEHKDDAQEHAHEKPEHEHEHE